MDERIRSYLQKYSSPSVIETKTGKFKYAVVVPAIDEYDNIITFLKSFVDQDPLYFPQTILLFVINNSEDASEEIKNNNYRTIELLRKIINQENSELTSAVINSGLQIGFIDASTEGRQLPLKDAGVGLARKIGMDAVLPYFSNGTEGIIICTDADCTFQSNYLTEIVNHFTETSAKAAVLNFRHNTDDEQNAAAVTCYEIFLRYYVLGLKYSQSLFGFHTIGSSMACTTEAYINVEGMNKRKAAEDFYFLEKLAKRYPVSVIKSTTVFPSSRKSWRVPFGTGQRVNRFLENSRNEYVLYHPECFNVLKEWHETFFNHDILSSTDYLFKAEKINRNLYEFLKSQGFEEDWNNILKNRKNSSGIIKNKIQWFDGFRTLKLVHHLRDTKFGLIPMFDAVDQMFRMHSADISILRDEAVPDLKTQTEYLERMRELDNK
jgi:hypothetical protein